MLLETKNKKVNLVLRTRKIVDISNSLKGNNFEEVYMKAVQECNLDALSKIIYLLAEDEEGKNSFGKSTDVYDFIDDYKKENNKSYNDIYKEIAEVINEEGFFTKKMTKKELIEAASNPLSGMNMNELVQRSAENAISKVAENQFTGFKG
ncbi:MAG: hypothetical protein RSB76_03345 [Clostridia bacterium]